MHCHPVSLGWRRCLLKINGLHDSWNRLKIPLFHFFLMVSIVFVLIATSVTQGKAILTVEATAVFAPVRCLAYMVRQQICCRGCSNFAWCFRSPPTVIVLCIICRLWQTTPALINKAAPWGSAAHWLTCPTERAFLMPVGCPQALALSNCHPL